MELRGRGVWLRLRNRLCHPIKVPVFAGSKDSPSRFFPFEYQANCLRHERNDREEQKSYVDPDYGSMHLIQFIERKNQSSQSWPPKQKPYSAQFTGKDRPQLCSGRLAEPATPEPEPSVPMKRHVRFSGTSYLFEPQ